MLGLGPLPSTRSVKLVAVNWLPDQFSATLDRLKHNAYYSLLDGQSYRTPKISAKIAVSLYLIGLLTLPSLDPVAPKHVAIQGWSFKFPTFKNQKSTCVTRGLKKDNFYIKINMLLNFLRQTL